MCLKRHLKPKPPETRLPDDGYPTAHARISNGSTDMHCMITESHVAAQNVSAVGVVLNSSRFISQCRCFKSQMVFHMSLSMKRIEQRMPNRDGYIKGSLLDGNR